MSQKWADAATQNCVWLFQTRRFPNDCYEEDPVPGTEDWDFPKYELKDEYIGDDDCWHTSAVFLTRLEAFEHGARQTYNVGQYGTEWRIYGVPAYGILVEHLASTGINQEYIDQEVSKYKTERLEWEKENILCKDRR